MIGRVWIALFALLTGATAMLVGQDGKSPRTTLGWTYNVIKDYGPAWPLPHAAVEPQKGRTYKVIFDLSTAASNPDEVLPGLVNAARLFNVFAADGAPPQQLKVVAVFHNSAGYAAMNNEVYRAKFGVENPNLKLIHELKAASTELLLCGQTFHDLNFERRDMLGDVELATSAAIVLVTYQNDGYALMPF